MGLTSFNRMRRNMAERQARLQAETSQEPIVDDIQEPIVDDIQEPEIAEPQPIVEEDIMGELVEDGVPNQPTHRKRK